MYVDGQQAMCRRDFAIREDDGPGGARPPRPQDMEYCYCVLVPAGGVDTEVSAGAVGIRSAFDLVAAESGFAGVLAFESFADLSLFKTSSTLLPPALMSSPIPCIVLHPAMNAMAAASATKLRFITIPLRCPSGPTCFASGWQIRRNPRAGPSEVERLRQALHTEGG